MRVQALLLAAAAPAAAFTSGGTPRWRALAPRHRLHQPPGVGRSDAGADGMAESELVPRNSSNEGAFYGGSFGRASEGGGAAVAVAEATPAPGYERFAREAERGRASTAGAGEAAVAGAEAGGGTDGSFYGGSFARGAAGTAGASASAPGGGDHQVRQFENANEGNAAALEQLQQHLELEGLAAQVSKLEAAKAELEQRLTDALRADLEQRRGRGGGGAGAAGAAWEASAVISSMNNDMNNEVGAAADAGASAEVAGPTDGSFYGGGFARGAADVSGAVPAGGFAAVAAAGAEAAAPGPAAVEAAAAAAAHDGTFYGGSFATQGAAMDDDDGGGGGAARSPSPSPSSTRGRGRGYLRIEDQKDPGEYSSQHDIELDTTPSLRYDCDGTYVLGC